MRSFTDIFIFLAFVLSLSLNISGCSKKEYQRIELSEEEKALARDKVFCDEKANRLHPLLEAGTASEHTTWKTAQKKTYELCLYERGWGK